MKDIVIQGIGWTALALIFYTAFMVTVLFSAGADDRRDVNRDGQVNLVDLSVLAVEISEANKAQ